MWKSVRVLCCPKEKENTIHNSNLGHLDNCFGCVHRTRCLENINEYEEKQNK